jgi:hypothetical protein
MDFGPLGGSEEAFCGDCLYVSFYPRAREKGE